MDTPFLGDRPAGTDKARWLILIYHLPREPSRHRVAVWRKLKTLGAFYARDGVAVLPEDAVTREQLEWLQLRVREAGGEATLWEALPSTVAESKNLVEAFRSSRKAAYEVLIESANILRQRAVLRSDEASLMKELRKLEREFRAERRRDYFRSPLRKEAADALRGARRTIREAGKTDAEAG